jgi:hypothetical protein
VGGSGGNSGGQELSVTGAHGAKVTATIPVTPGTATYYTEVALSGGGGDLAGGSGGAESDIRSCAPGPECPNPDASATDPRLVVAGGGGGAGNIGAGGGASGAAGGTNNQNAPCDGGAGASAFGATGANGGGCVNGFGGAGGTSSSATPHCSGGGGGAGGVSDSGGKGGGCTGSNMFGNGGAAFTDTDAGGGGSGWYGGAAGQAGGGGGGGSSYVEPIGFYISVADGDGAAPSITISWTAPPPTSTPETPLVLAEMGVGVVAILAIYGVRRRRRETSC